MSPLIARRRAGAVLTVRGSDVAALNRTTAEAEGMPPGAFVLPVTSLDPAPPVPVVSGAVAVDFR